MTEWTTTRMNEMIDPVMHVWGWEIPVYLFLGGFVAGMMVISGYLLFREQHERTDCSCFLLPGLSFVLLSAGMGALFLDLEHKAYVWRLYTTFEVLSPMSWGSWILLLVYPAILLNMLIRVPPRLGEKFPALQRWSDALTSHPVGVKTIGIVNMILGGSLGIYTGILLSSLGARPLWSTPILGLLFLVSGLSAAAAFVHMVARNPVERVMLAKADNGFLTIELFILGLFVTWMLSATQVHMEAVGLILGGPYTAVFWVVVVLMGIVIPLFYQSLAVNHKVPHCPMMPVLVILGGVALRFVIVQAGQHSHWMAAVLHSAG